MTLPLSEVVETLEETGDALALLLYAAGTPMGVDPQAWRQANRALRRLGYGQVEMPTGYEEAWVERSLEYENAEVEA
jgi:hypothetical protein